VYDVARAIRLGREFGIIALWVQSDRPVYQIEIQIVCAKFTESIVYAFFSPRMIGTPEL
jgi:hypothetical protein